MVPSNKQLRLQLLVIVSLCLAAGARSVNTEFNSSMESCGCDLGREKLNLGGPGLRSSSKQLLPSSPPSENSQGCCRRIVVPGGSFQMGEVNPPYVVDGESPVAQVFVGDFEIDSCSVTNRDFQEFIAATQYVTEAEKFGWSFVWFYTVSNETMDKRFRGTVVETPWWVAINNATWDHPEGPDSNISRRLDHPVVHVSWGDAQQFCNWRGGRLPTEAEWEYAARGGLHNRIFPWGNLFFDQNRVPRANIFEGSFPYDPKPQDGYLTTAPACSFLPNKWGLYNMVGNVWEWVSDWYSPRRFSEFQRAASIRDPRGPSAGTERVTKGGSFMCHDSYCKRYRCAARHHNTPDTSGHNIGFRCAY